MGFVTAVIFHRPASVGDPALVRVLADVRERLSASHSAVFRRAGADDVRVVSEWHEGRSFGEVLATLAPARGGLIVLSSGAVPLLNIADARRLVSVAASPMQVATTNNRYSSDVSAVANASVLSGLPELPGDNALPRWLEERAGYVVSELPGRDRLGLDLDTPLDIALAALARSGPGWLRRAAVDSALAIPRLEHIRALATDPRRELLVFGRSGARTLRWLETHVRCRVRFLAEERGLRASTTLAMAGAGSSPGDGDGHGHGHGDARHEVRATIGILLDREGPGSLGRLVGELADGAIIDSRVLLAHRLGADETSWPSANDRFASDLHLSSEIADPWLRELTRSAETSALPILMGGHSLVGAGIPLLLHIPDRRDAFATAEP